MASKNVETMKAIYAAFNQHKFDDAVARMKDDCIYRDVARGVDFRGRDEVKTFMGGWTRAFSDARVGEPVYIEAGNHVIVEFHARGTNDGPLGSFAPTGKTLDMLYCEVVRFGADGKVEQVHGYYDALTLLGQLGHLERPREITEQVATH